MDGQDIPLAYDRKQDRFIGTDKDTLEPVLILQRILHQLWARDAH